MSMGYLRKELRDRLAHQTEVAKNKPESGTIKIPRITKMMTKTTPNSKIDEILANLVFQIINLPDSESTEKLEAEAKAALTQLIVETKIEEGQYYLDNAAELSLKRAVGVTVIRDRIKALQSTVEGE